MKPVPVLTALSWVFAVLMHARSITGLEPVGALAAIGFIASSLSAATISLIEKIPLVPQGLFLPLSVIAYGIVALLTPDFSALERLLQLLGCIAFFWSNLAAAKRGNTLPLRAAAYLSGFLFALLPLALLFPIDERGFSSWFKNPNTLGGVVIAVLEVLFVYHIVKYGKLRTTIIITATVAFVLILLSKSRTSLMAFTMMLFVIFVRKWLPRRPLAAFFTLSVLYSPVAFVSYVTLSPGAQLSTKINALSAEFLGKRLLSGREELWPVILEKIYERPLWGHGYNPETLSNVTGLELSAHNWYLQVLFQAGVLGALPLLLFLIALWLHFCRHKMYPLSGVAAACLLATLVTQMFEVNLTQTNYSIGLPFWGIMGMAVGSNLLCRSIVKHQRLLTAPPRKDEAILAE